MSTFREDLEKEQKLGEYLDTLYPLIFDPEIYNIERISDINRQYQGIDLILNKNKREHLIDEKAQLDYINNPIPTFAFEISYLNKGKLKKGWLFDKNKLTNIYFLITDISASLTHDSILFKSLKIRGVSRNLLISYLESKGLDEERIFQIELNIRSKQQHGRFVVKELNPKTEGYFFYSLNNKNEQPINLILKLELLCNGRIGKILNPKS